MMRTFVQSFLSFSRRPDFFNFEPILNPPLEQLCVSNFDKKKKGKKIIPSDFKFHFNDINDFHDIISSNYISDDRFLLKIFFFFS